MNFNELSFFDFANLFYLVILLVFLITSLSSSKMSTNKIISYIGWWIVIALAALILYSFRYEIIEIKNRLLSDLFPSKAINKNHKELAINISQDGHYYMQIKVNNQNINFMIDTGASDVVIDRVLAQNLGIKLDNLFYDKVFSTANGQVYGASIFFDEIDISGIKFYNVAASVTDSELKVPLLGMSFLRRFYRYEFYKDRLILTL